VDDIENSLESAHLVPPLNIAGPGARGYAFIIDWHIRILLALVWVIVMHFVISGPLARPDGLADSGGQYLFLAILPASALYALYHVVVEIVMQGRTPGKRMVGVRIVTLGGQVPGWPAHIIRNLLRLLDCLPAAYAFGLATTMMTKNSVRLGDIAAGTVLIYEAEAHNDQSGAVPVNPAAVRLFGLEQAKLGQDLLNRWHDLDSQKRTALALKLLARLQPDIDPARYRDNPKSQLEQILGALKKK
jgi:uncharacterized RDD family membrane protein YckC